MAQVKVQTSAPLAGPGLSPGVPPAAMASPGSLGLQQQPSVNGTGPAPTPVCLAPSVGYGDDPVSATSPARFNRIQPQYKLLNERGPAHAKIFTVQLSLGDQVWEAEGTSIKKAQHTTASRALTESLLPRPAPRSPKVDINSNPVPCGAIWIGKLTAVAPPTATTNHPHHHHHHHRRRRHPRLLPSTPPSSEQAQWGAV
ncbi:hypothetical protein CRUP_004882 [Coryphaenoides rupestris]|nr:hypothetical protein CRUP_004882 [Coryphaenoides rupestris]